FSDPNDTPPNALQAVQIASLPALGTLSVNGVPVILGQFVSASDISAGLFTYAPVANANGTAYANFTFQVQDDGGTVAGGVDLDPTPNPITINVTPVNDLPAGTSKTVTTQEDTPRVFTRSDFGFTDPNDNPPNTLLAVRIASLPGAGTLLLDNVAVSLGQFIS